MRLLYVEVWRSCEGARHVPRSAARLGVALVVPVAGGLLTAALAIATQSFYTQQLRQRFELLANERYSRIAERFDDREQRLDGLRRFFSYSNEITRRSLTVTRGHCCTGPRRIPGRPGSMLDNAPISSDAPVPGGQAYQIRDQDAQGIWHPAPTRDYYYPVLYTQAASCKGSPTAWTCVDSPFARPPLFGLRHPAAWRSLRRWT